MTFQEYYDYMGWTTDVEWALGLTEEELLALPDFPYHEAKNIRLADHYLRPRTEEEKEVRGFTYHRRVGHRSKRTFGHLVKRRPAS
jgi:hypothetical protein